MSAVRVYTCDGEAGDPDAYRCLGVVSPGSDQGGSDFTYIPDKGQNVGELKEFIAVLRSSRLGSFMTPDEFLLTLPSRVNPYMGYAIPEEEGAT
jgi:hypothetical protein